MGMKWEYKRDWALDDEELNEYGKQGWELVAVDKGLHIFKRPQRVIRKTHEHLLVNDFCSTCDRHVSQMEQLGG